jgi:hypothetical protein
MEFVLSLEATSIDAIITFRRSFVSPPQKNIELIVAVQRYL